MNQACNSIQYELSRHLVRIGDILAGDAVSIVGPLAFGADEWVRTAIDELANAPGDPQKVAVVLGSRRGRIEVAERIVRVLRVHYDRVAFIIPDAAMSAGAAMALSGDEIHMDYFSMLGPITPHIEWPQASGRLVPVADLLAGYRELAQRSRRGKLSPVEEKLFLRRFEPLEISMSEQARKMAFRLAADWLVDYRFWPGTEAMIRNRGPQLATKRKRAAEILKAFEKAAEVYARGRGLSSAELESNVGLEIESFSQHSGLDRELSAYYPTLVNHTRELGALGCVNTRFRYIPYGATSPVLHMQRSAMT